MGRDEKFSKGNLVFLFIVAFFAGFILKKAIGNHVRIGYDDPSTNIMHGELYDIDDLEQKVLKQGVDSVENISNKQEMDN